MRKILTAIICSLLLPAGVAMAMTAGDKKDDKKGDKEGKGTKGGPVIIIWEDTWPIIFENADTDGQWKDFPLTCFPDSSGR
jgi:hypothetical protein